MQDRLQLTEIPRETSLSRSDFFRKYLRPQKPVVITNLTKEWPAKTLWTLEHIKKVAGNRTVPLYDNRPISSQFRFNEPHLHMEMGEYIDLLKAGPTNYRIFLYNLLKEVPELQKDFKFPDLGLRLIKQLPMLFFGGEGSKVFMHYDIDFANILHFHFSGKKKVILFPPSQTPYLYKVPHSLISREDIDYDRPDLRKFPALKRARGFVTELEHGEALFMPEGYWHQMTYLTPGFSMSLRGLPRSYSHISKALYNLLFMRHFDNLMRKCLGQDWIDYKNGKALKSTHRNNGIT